jgi:hypothetical protein
MDKEIDNIIAVLFMYDYDQILNNKELVEALSHEYVSINVREGFLTILKMDSSSNVAISPSNHEFPCTNSEYNKFSEELSIRIVRSICIKNILDWDGDMMNALEFFKQFADIKNAFCGKEDYPCHKRQIINELLGESNPETMKAAAEYYKETSNARLDLIKSQVLNIK